MAFAPIWLGTLASLVVGEVALRLFNNRFNRISIKAEQKSSQIFAPTEGVISDPSMTQDDLRQLAIEYDEHVKRCVAHYGNWSNAIKSEDSMHMPDYQGQFLNVLIGLRVTTNQPPQFKQRLYIFGGSTVFCGEVSDSLTLSSQLQVLINEANYSTTVINFGRHGSTFRNRLLYLELCNLGEGDIVLFWFGVNELGWKLMEGKTNVSILINFLKNISEGLKFLSKYLALLDVVSKIFQFLIFHPFCRSYAYFETRQSLKNLKKLSELRGFKYKVILQPNLLTKKVRTSREELMLEFFLSRAKGQITQKFLSFNYPRFRTLISQFDGFDASGSFKQTDREVFVDWVHLNSEGNQLMAKVIFDCLDKSGSFETR